MLAVDRKTTRQVQLEVKSAYLNLTEAQARCRVSQASVASAEQSLTLVQRQFDGGAATVTRYLEAELDLTRARQRAAAARYDRVKASADIARSLGLWARQEKCVMRPKTLKLITLLAGGAALVVLILYSGGF